MDRSQCVWAHYCLNEWQEVQEKAGSLSTPPGSSLPGYGNSLEMAGSATVEAPRNSPRRRVDKVLQDQVRHGRSSRFASISNPPWKEAEKFPTRSKRFQSTLERNSRLNFEPISRGERRSLKRNLTGRLGIEIISNPDRRRLEGAMENPPRKFPDSRIRLLSRFLILEMISRHRLEAFPTSRQMRAAMRLS